VGAKLPLAVLDARGERLAILVFADAKAAAVCRAVVAADGAATAVAEALPDEARAAPPENGTLGGHDMTFVENGNAQIGVLVGTVKEPIQDVSINMDADAAWFATSKANGWYAIWWPGTDKPLTVASSNRSIVVDGYTP
jgi:hypothetical protein